MEYIKRGNPVTGFIMAGLSVLLFIGVGTFLAPCGVHDDGSFGSCHWAGQAVIASGIVLLALSIIHIIAKTGKSKSYVSVCIAALSVMTAIIPGTFINLCKMPTMRCLSVMQPAVLIIALVIAGIAIADAIVRNASAARAGREF